MVFREPFLIERFGLMYVQTSQFLSADITVTAAGYSSAGISLYRNTVSATHPPSTTSEIPETY